MDFILSDYGRSITLCVRRMPWLRINTLNIASHASNAENTFTTRDGVREHVNRVHIKG